MSREEDRDQETGGHGPGVRREGPGERREGTRREAAGGNESGNKAFLGGCPAPFEMSYMIDGDD